MKRVAVVLLVLLVLPILHSESVSAPVSARARFALVENGSLSSLRTQPHISYLRMGRGPRTTMLRSVGAVAKIQMDSCFKFPTLLILALWSLKSTLANPSSSLNFLCQMVPTTGESKYSMHTMWKNGSREGLQVSLSTHLLTQDLTLAET